MDKRFVPIDDSISLDTMLGVPEYSRKIPRVFVHAPKSHHATSFLFGGGGWGRVGLV